MSTASGFATGNQRLQWGHDVGVVEDADTAAKNAEAEKLQWGHDVGVVEDQNFD